MYASGGGSVTTPKKYMAVPTKTLRKFGLSVELFEYP
jgi:hypothetical protein